MLKCILIDNDGILVDTEGLFFRATQEALARHGAELTRAEFIETCMRQARGAWHLLEALGRTAEQIRAVRAERDQLYLELLGTEEIAIPGAREFLETVRQWCRVCVVTSSKRIHFDRIHQRTGFTRLFDRVLTVEDYPQCKPSPVPYLTALDAMQVTAREAIAIEDSERGLTAADGAGLRTIVIPHELTVGQDFSRAWRIVGSLEGALKEIRKLGERS